MKDGVPICAGWNRLYGWLRAVDGLRPGGVSATPETRVDAGPRDRNLGPHGAEPLMIRA
jgi:hypothetical protein